MVTIGSIFKKKLPANGITKIKIAKIELLLREKLGHIEKIYIGRTKKNTDLLYPYIYN